MRLIIDSDMVRMPQNCHGCYLCYGGWCAVIPSECDERCPDDGRPEWCPLSEDTAPTIDAIPVDWLVQMRDLRRAAVAAHPDISEGRMEMLQGINFVLELWEDEKEGMK